MGSHMQPFVFVHFSSNDYNGFLDDCNITLINKIDESDPNRGEKYRRIVLKTSTRFGMNIECFVCVHL